MTFFAHPNHYQLGNSLNVCARPQMAGCPVSRSCKGLSCKPSNRSSMPSMATLEELALYREVRYGSNCIQALSPAMASHNAEAPCKSSLLHVPLRARHRIRAPALFFLITDGWIWLINVCTPWEGARYLS